MWRWFGGIRSDNYAVSAIPDSQIRDKTFIFIGRQQPEKAIDVRLILDDFDQLMSLYEFVEGIANFPAQAPETHRRGFIWSPGNKARVIATTFNAPARTVEKSLRHNQIQHALFEHLQSLNQGDISGEQITNDGTYIDVAVRHNGEYTYYEIKTGLSAQSCIREALGQLLEYSHWPGALPAARLVIVGEPNLDDTAKDYLETLREKYSLSLEYRQFIMEFQRLV